MPRANLGLDRIVVERRCLPASRPFIVTLPNPVSVNAMYGQAPGRKRFHSAKYAAWIDEATIYLKAARPPKFKGEVFVSITCEDTGPTDLDNKVKGILDLLVRHGVIEDDSRPFVRGIKLSWGNLSGCRVEVRPYSYSETRTAA